MGATILWKPVKREGKALGVSAPSSFLTAMERCFGCPPPYELGEVDIPRLTGMESVYGPRGDDNPFSKLIAIIEKVEGPIEIWPEY